MKKYFILPVLVLAATSCATQELYLNITQPAPVTIAPEIKTIGIIDRSNPTDQTKTIDMIDQLLTLEGDELDSIGTLEAIRGVTQELKENDRFNEVKLLTDIKFKASSVGSLPSPLTWEQVEGICLENGTDALFALEMYDTDTHVSYSTEKTQIETPLGNIPALEHIVSMEILVKTGWRIYSPADKAILDEYIVAETVNFTGRGINPVVAVSALMNREAAVKEVSNKAGHIYALRLIPYRLRATRDYFVKGTDNFKIAKRRAQLGKWDEAAELWEKETSNPDRKVAGRAHYNMAIINEINGDLETAKTWAQKAYADYKIKLALDYVRILENRAYNEEVLKYQEQR
jgi:tetratricopeptide (TPR) repeat protein